MHGRGRYAVLLVCFGLTLALTACAPAGGASVAAQARVSAAQAARLPLSLADMPVGFLMPTDLSPTDAQLADLLRQPGAAAWLLAHNRQASVYRTFALAQPEPAALDGVIQAQVEVDIFATPAAAQAWYALRGTQRSDEGAPLDVAAPGQRHRVQAQTNRAGNIVATHAVLVFVDHNVYVELSTTTVGPALSIADTERFADQIDARILAAAQ